MGVAAENYTLVEPCGGRNGLRLRRCMKALAYYDLIARVRRVNAAEARTGFMRRCACGEALRISLALTDDKGANGLLDSNEPSTIPGYRSTSVAEGDRDDSWQAS